MTRIRDALRSEDYETIRTIGHQMKGSGGGYGFDAISDIGEAVERAAKAHQDHEIARQTNALESYLNRLSIEFY